MTVKYACLECLQIASLSAAAAAAAKSLQSCPTLCNPTDGSPLGSSVPGILQARVLEWGATAFSDPYLGGVQSLKEKGQWNKEQT